MLKVYDYLEEVLATEHFQQSVRRANLRYYASDLMQHLGESDLDFRAKAVRHAMQVCHSAGLPLDKNFKRIYVYSGEGMASDWLMSPLASYLFLINGDPENPMVARAQMVLLMKLGGTAHKKPVEPFPV